MTKVSGSVYSKRPSRPPAGRSRFARSSGGSTRARRDSALRRCLASTRSLHATSAIVRATRSARCWPRTLNPSRCRASSSNRADRSSSATCSRSRRASISALTAIGLAGEPGRLALPAAQHGLARAPGWSGARRPASLPPPGLRAGTGRRRRAAARSGAGGRRVALRRAATTDRRRDRRTACLALADRTIRPVWPVASVHSGFAARHPRRSLISWHRASARAFLASVPARIRSLSVGRLSAYAERGGLPTRSPKPSARGDPRLR
jgi:hypothetical protein